MENPQEIFDKSNIRPSENSEKGNNIFEALADKDFHFKPEENKLNEKPNIVAEYYAYMKFYQRVLALHYKEDKYQNRQEEIKEYLPFEFNLYTYKNSKIENLPLDWAKNNFYNEENVGDEIIKSFKFQRDRIKLEKFSGLYPSISDFQSYINKLPKYSFGIWAKIRFKQPYYSADDDPFYPINPIMKEPNFKVPMVRGSSWKGVLANIFIQKVIAENNIKGFKSFARIFGLGSNEFRNFYEKEKNETALLNFALFDLGIQNFEYKKDETNLLNEILSKSETFLLPHKGRLIIYPTYFDRLSLEVINPHDRVRRAGTQPIYYEVVPKDATGILQMIYIPYDGILTENSDLEKQVKDDLRNIIKALVHLQTEGIGAKTKLGWGQFEFVERCTICSDFKLSDFCNNTEN